MFRHILIPTDGSALAGKAIEAGVGLARDMGARITGLYAQEPHPLHLHAGAYELEKTLAAEIERREREYGEKSVSAIERAALAAGVPFEAVVVKSARPHEAIIDAARERHCDAICMASHGRGGLAGLVLGSVTDKVLTHSRIPVVVFR